MAAVSAPSITNNTSPSKSKYRPEIDGLRAFAVVAVIINHFNKDLLPSGYLGVDIFFVISGYVITSSLAGRESKNFLDFLTGFYERRIKRLVPALVVFVLITSVLISLFNPDPDLALTTGATSVFGYSNIFLFQESTDYFAQSTELNPFTHTWSLGVEEQFYLLFPFLIWFSGFGRQTAKGARNLFFWVGALTIASLISFIYLNQVNQPAAYFLMPPRFWEMAAGCLIFIGFQRRAKIEQALEQVPPLLVVAAMTSVMFRPIGGRGGTIAIVILAAVLIACLKKGTAAYDFFTLEKVVYVGLISYSLYLWHWGVLSISRWTIGIHYWSAPLQVGAMILFANLSYQFIEKPFRVRKWKNRPKARVLAYGVASTISTALVIFSFKASDLISFVYLGRKSGIDYQFGRLFAASGVSSNRSKCFKSFEQCLAHKKSPKDREYFLWIGDSHAAHLLPMAEMLYKYNQVNYSVYQSGGSFHQPFPVIQFERANRATRNIISEGARMRTAYKNAINSQKLSTVIISSYLLYYFGSNDLRFYGELGRKINASEAMDLWFGELQDVASELKSKNIKLVIILPTPEFPLFPGDELCTKQPFRLSIPTQCKQTTKEEGGRGSIVKGLIRISKDYDNVYLFDASNAFCRSKGGGQCSNFLGDLILYMDASHLKTEASPILYPSFLTFLTENKILR